MIKSYSKFVCESNPYPTVLSAPLCRTPAGFVYLKIPDGVIDGYLILLEGLGAENPSVTQPDPSKDVGCHMTVIRSSETNPEILDKVDHFLGNEYTYTMEGLYHVDPDGWDDVTTCWMIKCKSKQIEIFRELMGLEPTYKGFDLHITCGVLRDKEHKAPEVVTESFVPTDSSGKVPGDSGYDGRTPNELVVAEKGKDVIIQSLLDEGHGKTIYNCGCTNMCKCPMSAHYNLSLPTQYDGGICPSCQELVDKGHGPKGWECGHLTHCRCKDPHKLPIQYQTGDCPRCSYGTPFIDGVEQ